MQKETNTDRLIGLAMGAFKSPKTPLVLLTEHTCRCGRKITDYREIEFMRENGECGMCDKNRGFAMEDLANESFLKGEHDL